MMNKNTRKWLFSLYDLYRLHRLRQDFQKLGVPYPIAIPTHTKPNELEQLYFLTKKLDSNINVLEIGSYLGASSCYIAAGLLGKNARLICVDTWDNETMPEGKHDTFAEFEKNIASFRSMTTVIRKDSRRISYQDFSGKVGMVFIDGDHGYEVVKNDVEKAKLWLCEKPKPILVFHDHIAFSDVSRVIGELLLSGRWFVRGVEANLLWLVAR